METLNRFFDGYGRMARLYPALLAVAPLVVTVALLRPEIANHGFSQSIVSVAVLFGGTYLLAALARSRGKSREEDLRKKWGDWPTTILLRHSDDTIDPVTKARYHRLLGTLAGTPMPTKTDELLDASGADHRYRAATTQLIEARRGKKYKLLHGENASYGFRRNLLGLRTTGIAVSLLSILIAILAQLLTANNGGFSFATIQFGPNVPVTPLVALCFDVVFLALWIFEVTSQFVRQAANEYALALFRTLDDAQEVHNTAPMQPSATTARST